MTFLLAMAAMASASATSHVGDWEILCINDAPADDGLFDRCEMKKIVTGVRVSDLEIDAIRDASGIVVTAKLLGCSDLPVAPRAMIPVELLNEPDADKRLIGAQFMVLNTLGRQCMKARGIAVSLGGNELPALLATTAKIRMNH